MEEKTAVYLVMVTDQNNNKYYNLQNNGDGTFTATWGRVSGHESSKIYNIGKWDSTIKSKIKKGYKDVTYLMTEVIEDSKVEEKDSTSSNDKFASITIKSIKEVIKRLYNYANQMVESSYKVKSNVVTQAMVDNAQWIIDYLANNVNSISVEDFNKTLLDLFATIPRSMSDVRIFLADKDGDFERILQREQDTLDSMAGFVYQRKQKTEGISEAVEQKTEGNILQEMGIEMEETSPEEDEMIKKLMGDVSDRFYKAWRVCNQETEEKYREFQEKHHYDNVKLCCHGSRNTNWFNILKIGLRWKVANVITNGSMFGSKALYFSNPDKPIGGVRKSIGYTSLSGSYWANGTDKCGFLAFYEVALGKPYDVYSFDSQYYKMDREELTKRDPEAGYLHAHGNTSMLRNDELVVYDTAQMTIRYLVEIH